jgi:hypothetical protein
MYQFDSSGNSKIIIRATTNVNLLGVAYAADDVVATFENAFFELSFINNNKSINQSSITLLNYNVMNLDSITIEAKNLSYSHYNFMATNRFLDQNILIPIKETIKSDSSGVAFFTRIPVNIKPVFIKNNFTKFLTTRKLSCNTPFYLIKRNCIFNNNNKNYIKKAYSKVKEIYFYDMYIKK